MPKRLQPAKSGPAAQNTSAEIRAEMGRQRLSGLRLAAATGISQNYIAKRLRDEVSFNFNDIEAISKALNVNPLQLLIGNRPAATNPEDQHLAEATTT